MSERLVPKPHMLKSIRARNWNLAGAIQELVDNSLGHGAATLVQVDIHNGKHIAVFDDGTGIDDINRIFRIGDASDYDTLSQIGQYGIGAKHATIYLGDHVTATTIRKGFEYMMTVDWAKVERSGEWPLAYSGQGKVSTATSGPFKSGVGTRIIVRELARNNYHVTTSEKLASELGQVFAPALRRRVRIVVTHTFADGTRQWIDVIPFTPTDLIEEVTIAGELSGGLRWTGRAGLSASLTDRHNGAHIAFGHRVIETAREPFGGMSAPTLYCEVTLDATTPWKHSLSEHKDKVVRHRDELMESIHAQIKPLLEQSAKQASHLALSLMAAPIENTLTRALKAAGILHIDLDEEPDEGGEHGDGPGPVERGRRLYTPTDAGDRAKEANKPTGVKLEWLTESQLEGRLWNWKIAGKQMIIQLDEDQFKLMLGFPPRFRERHAVQQLAAVLAHAIEGEYWNGPASLISVVTPKLRKQLDLWAEKSNRFGSIAPYINRAILDHAA